MTAVRQEKMNGNGRHNGTFDPFADLLAAQASRPPDRQAVNLRTITPFQRALLSLDGSRRSASWRGDINQQ